MLEKLLQNAHIICPTIDPPGAISAVLFLTDNHIYTQLLLKQAPLVTIGVLGIALIQLLLSSKIIKLMDTGSAFILTRVMGMILAAFSVELIMTALEIKQWVKLD